MFYLASPLTANPNRGESMMAEVAIAHLRAFRQEFTVNDLIYATEKSAHVAEAVESGGLKFKGQPTQVYTDWIDEAEVACKDLIDTRAKKHSAYHVERTPVAKVDYSRIDVAQQTWKMVSRHLAKVFQEGGVAHCVHKALNDHLPDLPPLQTVSTDSLEAFAADVGELLKVPAGAATPAEENIDDEVPPLADHAGPAAPQASPLSLSLAQLAQHVPDELQTAVADNPGLMDDIPEEQLLPGESTAVAVVEMPEKAEIQASVWKFLTPAGPHDVVEAAIRLSTQAMYSRSLGASLPDRRHGSIEQRWMAVDVCRGPRGASPDDFDTVQRDEIVKYMGDFWRVCGCFSKYYGRWSLVTEPAALTATYQLLLQRLTVNPSSKPYVLLNPYKTPIAVIAPASECQHAGYKLLSCGLTE